MEKDIISTDIFKNKNSYDNLGTIKVLLIMKKIFLFLTETLKLDLIKYSKNFQKKIGVDIDNYKKASGKLRIIGKFGKGQEYKLDTYEFIFEGEFKNGKKNGKGKEYYENGRIKYEGSYLNGRKNGKGKEYYEIGRIKYEG